jgi:hypothetical protein
MRQPKMAAQTMRLIIQFAAVLALFGCAQVQQAVNMDTTGAIVRAKADGSPAALRRIECYEQLAPLFVPAAGVVDFYEQIMEAQGLAQGPCAPIVAGITLMVARKVPFSPIP